MSILKSTREWSADFENGRGLGAREDEIRAFTAPLLVSTLSLSLNSGGQVGVHLRGEF